MESRVLILLKTEWKHNTCNILFNASSIYFIIENIMRNSEVTEYSSISRVSDHINFFTIVSKLEQQ